VFTQETKLIFSEISGLDTEDKYLRDQQIDIFFLGNTDNESFTKRLKRALSILFRKRDPKNDLIWEMVREINRLESESLDYQKSFRLYTSCIKRATVAYRASHPGSTGLPDSMAALVAYMELKENETPKVSHQFSIEQRKVARHESWQETSFFSHTVTGAVALRNLLSERFKNFRFRVVEVENSLTSKKKVIS
jgi:hypothetical protein